jgi:hypothetical protein
MNVILTPKAQCLLCSLMVYQRALSRTHEAYFAVAWVSGWMNLLLRSYCCGYFIFAKTCFHKIRVPYNVKFVTYNVSASHYGYVCNSLLSDNM